MAADALKEKAKEMGVDIKVETNGSGGIKHALTAKEIEEAPAIIVAADKQVEMERFKGKHVIEVPVTAGIRRPQELIEKQSIKMRRFIKVQAAVLLKRKMNHLAKEEADFTST